MNSFNVWSHALEASTSVSLFLKGFIHTLRGSTSDAIRGVVLSSRVNDANEEGELSASLFQRQIF